jgi:isoleucyl-tRNA synthetase
VHTAPAHGAEDFLVCKSHGLAPKKDLVDGAGKFLPAAGTELVGLSVLGDGNTKVLELLRASKALLWDEDYTHRYPCVESCCNCYYVHIAVQTRLAHG